MNLKSTILKLIELKREGDYWDFKLNHHENSSDLIHDIICLANNIHAEGDRYLIFGIHPTNFSIVGVKFVPANRQADIIDTINHVPFAGGSYPSVELHELKVGTKRIDVLVIKDTKNKPFYLTGEYGKKRKKGEKDKKLNVGAIYSRVRDSNTPKNETANTTDIVKMWKQRFESGLPYKDTGLSPEDRVYQYLDDLGNWETVDDGTSWYYKLFPEFTLEFLDDGKEVKGHNDSWRYLAIKCSSHWQSVVLRYHRTVLWKGISVSIDEWRAVVMAPETIPIFQYSDIIDLFYAYIFDSFTFRVHKLLVKSKLNTGTSSVNSCLEPILIFESKDEKDQFCAYAEANPSYISEQQYDSYYDNVEAPDIDKKHIINSAKAKFALKKWRARKVK